MKYLIIALVLLVGGCVKECPEDKISIQEIYWSRCTFGKCSEHEAYHKLCETERFDGKCKYWDYVLERSFYGECEEVE